MSKLENRRQNELVWAGISLFGSIFSSILATEITGKPTIIAIGKEGVTIVQDARSRQTDQRGQGSSGKEGVQALQSLPEQEASSQEAKKRVERGHYRPTSARSIIEGEAYLLGIQAGA